jgi:hypothetical protein
MHSLLLQCMAAYVIIFAEFNYYISPRAIPRDARGEMYAHVTKSTHALLLSSRAIQLAMIETYFAFVWRAGSRGTPHIYDSSFAIYVC